MLRQIVRYVTHGICNARCLHFILHSVAVICPSDALGVRLDFERLAFRHAVRACSPRSSTVSSLWASEVTSSM
jgi:hypothetical protein